MSHTEQKLQPCLAELLRTCIKPESMVLQVDGIVTQETTVDLGNRSSASAPSKTITRFHLTDGELSIQALLQPILLADYVLKVGDRIKVRDFVVRKARRLNHSGKVIYLNIQDFEVLGQHTLEDWYGEGGLVKSVEEERLEPTAKRRKRHTNRVAFAGLPDPDDSDATDKQLPAAKKEASVCAQEKDMVTNGDAQSEDEFESLNVNHSQVQQRRQTLHTIQQASIAAAGSRDDRMQPESPRIPQKEPTELYSPADFGHEEPSGIGAKLASSLPSTPGSFLPTHNIPSLTPPYHSLSSLLSPSLPSKNYSLTTLAIITYVSSALLSKPNSPFPPKRNIRILDPSLSQDPSHPQGLSVAVYVDAKSFRPVPGTIALFRGIVMQKFGREVILNAYATLKDKSANEKWYIDDETALEEMGFDVAAMRRWWEDRVNENARRSGKNCSNS